MIKIDVATLFPEVCEAYLSESIIGRARKSEFIEAACHNIRDYAGNKHNSVDDKPYGGGTGMVLTPEPVYACVTDIIKKGEAVIENSETGKNSIPKLIYTSPQGKTLNQELVKELASEDWLIILCGHYEGVDSRVIEELDFMEISVGDYVTTGGELPALIIIDAVSRLQDGVLPDASAFMEDSHWDGTLEHPLYTRPEVWRERRVPEVLLSGNHENVRNWKKERSLEVTKQKRPDMLNN